MYLSLCNSEGVGLGACQTALKGKIIVMTGYGGQTEYIKVASWIRYNLDIVKVPATFVEWIRPPQRWGYPCLNHAVACLQHIYDNLPKYLDSAKQNRPFITNKFSYVARGSVLKDILGGGTKVPP